MNARLVETCRTHGAGFLRPFGAVSPLLPDWREELRRCHEVYKMPGIRLHPNYHDYTLDAPAFVDLLAEAAKRGLIVQIALKMEDPRTLHPLLKNLPTTDPAPLLGLFGRTPRPQVVLLNALLDLRGDALKRTLATPGISADIAMLEGVAGLERLVAQVGHERLLFGSHAPLFYAHCGPPEAQGVKPDARTSRGDPPRKRAAAESRIRSNRLGLVVREFDADIVLSHSVRRRNQSGASCREIQFLEAAWLMAPRAGACVSQKKLQGLPFGAGDNRKREPRFEQTGTGTGASGSCEWE